MPKVTCTARISRRHLLIFGLLISTLTACNSDNGESVDSVIINDEYYAALAQNYEEFVPDPSIGAAQSPEDYIVRGKWGEVINWPEIATGAANLPDGRLMTWASTSKEDFRTTNNFTFGSIYNPDTDTFAEENNSVHDTFCAGVSMLPDGRVIAAGGRPTITKTSIFDLSSNDWTPTNELNYPRRYATTTTLPTGQVLTTLGTTVPYAEIWTQGTGWDVRTNLSLQKVINDDLAPSNQRHRYPALNVAPDGSLFHAGPTSELFSLTLGENEGVVYHGDRENGEPFRLYNTTVMYNIGKMLIAGGGKPSLSSAMTVDLNGAAPVISATNPMNHPRSMHNSVVLPNGKVMVIGGTSAGIEFSDQGSQLTPELWDPETGIWQELAQHIVPRNYHSTALLMKDGRLAALGGGLCGGCPTNHKNGQFYEPPYLFNTDGSRASRPEIINGEAAAAAGDVIDIQGSGDIVKFNMVRLVALTHHHTTDQRLVPLSIQGANAGYYQLSMPNNPNVLIPGYYWIFGFNSAGVPTIGHTIKITVDNDTGNITIDGPAPSAGITEPPGMESTDDSENETSEPDYGAAIAAISGESLISLEAEHYETSTNSSTHAWTKTSLINSSNNEAVVTSPDNGALSANSSDSPGLEYHAVFEQTGTWYVWLRGWGNTNAQGEGNSDSVHAGLNGQLSNTANNIDYFPAGWHWSNNTRDGARATISVQSTGPHKFNLWMREDGLAIDKIVITTDPAYIPDGTGPDATTGTTLNNSNSNESPNPALANIDATEQWEYHQTSDGSTVTARHEAGGVELNGKLYVLGGRGTRDVSVFDPVQNNWTYKSAAPIELNHYQPVAWNNKIWVLGAFTGRYPDETSVAEIYTYTPATDQWDIVGTIPQARRRGSAGAAVYNNLIYLVGGNTNGHRDGAKPWLDAYDPQSGQWQTLPDAPNARDHATIAITNGKLVVAAGRQSAYPNTFGKMLAITNVYDFSTGNWTTAANIPTQRAGTMTVPIGEEVVVIGGESAGIATARDNVEAYNVISNTWRALDSLNTGRHGGAATVLDGKIHIVSGSENRGGAPESFLHEILKTPIDKSNPSALATFPVNGASVESATTVISGISSDSGSGVDRVRVRIQRLGVSPAEYWNGSEWSSHPANPDADLNNDGTAWTLYDVDFNKPGNYRIRVIATDKAGNTNTATENPKTDFSVGISDDTDPSAQATSPSDGEFIVPTTTSISGIASDDNSGVDRVRVRIQRLGVSPAEYWNGSEWSSNSAYPDAELNDDGTAWTLPDIEFNESGNYRTRIVATDKAGNTASAIENPKTDFEVGISDDTDPSAQATSPSDGEFIVPTTTSISGIASDDNSGVDRVRVRIQRLGVSPAEYWNGSEWSSNSAYPDAELNDDGTAWTLPDIEFNESGNYRTRIVATDKAGNTASAIENPKTDFEVGIADDTDPTAQATSPSDAEFILPATTSISGIASDDSSGVDRVRVRIHRLGVYPALFWSGSEWSTFSVFLDADLNDDGTAWTLANVDLNESGNYRIRVIANDKAGNTAKAIENSKTDFSVGVPDDTDPSAQATSPSDGASISPTTTFISGIASDNGAGVDRIRVRVQRLGLSPAEYWNGSEWSTFSVFLDADLNNNGTVWTQSNVDLSKPGNYRIRVIATDKAGNTATAIENPKTDFAIN